MNHNDHGDSHHQEVPYAFTTMGYSTADHHAPHAPRGRPSNRSNQYCPNNPNMTYHIDEGMRSYWCQAPFRDAQGNIIGGEFNEGTL